MRIFLVALLIGFSIDAFSQNDTTQWVKGGFTSLTFSQVSLTNWAAGGDNSVAVNSNLSLFANRITGRSKWENSLDLAYGLVKQAEESFRKSNDLINLVTSYNYRINNDNEKLYYTALMDFRTQFYEGLDAEGNFISDFMAPGYMIISAGVSYYPNEKLSFTLQPVSGKLTFVTDQDLADQGAYGVEPAVFSADGTTRLSPGKKLRSELGNFFRAKYKNDIFESRLELFSSYKQPIKSTDINWQNTLVLQLTKVLSANVFTQLIYDDDILIENDDNGDGTIQPDEVKARVQFKSVLGVGLTYNFGAKTE